MGVLSLQGPKSREILQQLTDTDLSNESFSFSTHKIVTIAGHRVRAIRLSFVGEMGKNLNMFLCPFILLEETYINIFLFLGWEFHIPYEAALPIYKAVHSAGQKFGLINSGYRALDSLSCEKGYVLWHADIRPDDTPLEAGLGFACKMKTSTPFLGREALEKQKKEKLRKKLVTFTLNDPSVSVIGLEGILRDRVPVGFVRRAEYGFYLGTSLARAYIRMPCEGAVTKEFLSTGEWEIDVMGHRYPVTVHQRPPFDPKNLRVKGFYEESESDHKILRA